MKIYGKNAVFFSITMHLLSSAVKIGKCLTTFFFYLEKLANRIYSMRYRAIVKSRAMNPVGNVSRTIYVPDGKSFTGSSNVNLPLLL